MGDFILIAGDQAIFDPAFGAAVVTVQPGEVKATGMATRGGKKVCVDGDEALVMVPNCQYMAPPHTVPGMGTLKVLALGPDQKAQKTNSAGKVVLLKGSKFQAKFEVTAQAKTPQGVPDPVPMHQGTGSFVTMNQVFSGI